MNERAPDYAFENGLTADIHSVRNGQEERYSIPPEALRRLPNAGDSPAQDAELREQIFEHARTVKGLGGKAIEATSFGDQDADNVTTVLYGWGGNFRHDVAIREAQALYQSNPDTQFLLINPGGTGHTDTLPRTVRTEMARRGNYGPLGEHYATALKNSGILDGRPVNLRGHSQGARAALGMAPHFEDGIDTLVVNDPTGSRDLSFLGLANAFMRKESGHLSNYLDAKFDPEASRLQKEGSAPTTVAETVRSLRQMLLTDPRGLHRETLESALLEAAPNVRNELRVITPELSELSRPDDVAAILGRVLQSAQLQDSLLFEQWVIRDHTHSWMAATPAIQAHMYQSMPHYQ